MDIHVKEPSLPSSLNDPTVTTLLRPDQISQHEQDVQFCEAALKNPNVQDKREVHTRLRNLEHQYAKQCPQPLDGKTKDRLASMSAQLEEKIKDGMLSSEEMRKNPAGSVDKHMRWERANKARIMLWKKVQRYLNADNSHHSTWDSECSNVEKLRPHGPVGYGYRGDAQISGHMAYQGIPDENWPFDPPQNTALDQVKKRKPLSEEHKQALRDRLAKAREIREQNKHARTATPGHAESPVAVETESTPQEGV